MIRIGLIKERKVPSDNRVALTPTQCAQIHTHSPAFEIVVESSPYRCFTDDEYRAQGIKVTSDLGHCDILMGVKELPVDALIGGKTYFFFSHTKKKQPANKSLMRGLIDKNITMVDYECLTHSDEQRILGFGLYAGIVGAHNGLLTYGRKFDRFQLPPAHTVGSYSEIIVAYGKVKIPNIKIAVTGSGKVAAGVLDVMTRLDIEAVEPADFLTHQYEYPVYTHLKGSSLYARKDNGLFHRDDFHANPGAYKCLFSNYVNQTDILMNGIYWEEDIARLFQAKDIQRYDWRISVIADITCDYKGSVPINLGETSIADSVYGIDRATIGKVPPYQNTNTVIDVMAVDNLPNELAKDASQYFGVHIGKYILPELLLEQSELIDRATICSHGRLTKRYEYLADYAYS